jgi:hypothetical protein
MRGYTPPTEGDRVIAFRDYWHEDPYGPGVIAEELPRTAYDGTTYYRIVLDEPVAMASPPRMERELITNEIQREEVSA